MTFKAMLEKQGSIKKTLNTLSTERASVTSKMTALNDKETFTDEDQQQYDALKAEVAGIDAKIKRNNELLANVQEDMTNHRQNVDTSGRQQFQFDTGSEPDPETRELSQYRITSAIRQRLNDERLSGFELEMHQEAIHEARNAGYELKGNVHMPQKVMTAGRKGNIASGSQMAKIVNALTATGGSGGDQGGVTIEDEIVSMIDILRAKIPFIDSATGANDGLGANFWGDLNGNVSFPKAEEDPDDLTERTENQAAEEQDPTFSQVNLSPRRFHGVTELSQQLIMQSSIDVENWLRNYLMYKLSKSFNKSVINYLLGLAGTNAITLDTNGAKLTWADIVDMETLVEDADADIIEPRKAYFTNARVKGALKKTPVETGTSDFIWSRKENDVNNYPAVVSSLVPKNLTKGTGTNLSAIFFANWSQLYLAQWGGTSLLVNPYSKDDTGLTRINVYSFMDREAAHAKAFSVCKEAITTN